MGQVLDKLATEPVEDLRIDFAEPARDDAAEEARIAEAALAWGVAAEADALSPCGGIRVPGLGAADRSRSIRTVGRFLEALGEIPEGFVVTVPAVATIAEIEAMVRLADLIEKTLDGRLTFEVQLEGPQAVLGPQGSVLVSKMIHHAEGRLRSVHLVPEGFGGARLADHALTLVRAGHPRDRGPRGRRVDAPRADPRIRGRGVAEPPRHRESGAGPWLRAGPRQPQLAAAHAVRRDVPPPVRQGIARLTSQFVILTACFAWPARGTFDS